MMRLIGFNYIRNRKCQDYVYVRGECQSTLLKVKHHLRHENKGDENKMLSYCEKLRYMQNKIKNNEKVVLHYVKAINLLSFQTRFSKTWPIYRRQVVHPRHQTLQGQSVATPGAPMWLIIHASTPLPQLFTIKASVAPFITQLSKEYHSL